MQENEIERIAATLEALAERLRREEPESVRIEQGRHNVAGRDRSLIEISWVRKTAENPGRTYSLTGGMGIVSDEIRR